MINTRFALAAMAALLAGACHSEGSQPALTDHELDALMARTVQQVVGRFRQTGEFCIAGEVVPSTFQTSDDPIVDGWRKGPTPDVYYRDVRVPPRRQLPAEAIAALPVGMRAAQCQHRIVFEQPYAVQLRVKGERYMQVYLPFADRCPICGGGYGIAYRQTPSGWEIEPPGIHTTWIS